MGSVTRFALQLQVNQYQYTVCKKGICTGNFRGPTKISIRDSKDTMILDSVAADDDGR